MTDVDTSPDLRHARVLRQRPRRPRRSARRRSTACASAHGFLQGRIGGELHLKHTPELRFLYDDTAERAARLEALLIDDREDAAA